MLVQYAVENYKSIREEVVINFRAEGKNTKSNWATTFCDKISPFYKCIGLFGPNASGKSNIIDSFAYAVGFVNMTITRKDSAKIAVEPFAFSDEYKNKPTSFEFIFYCDAIKYVYGFSINSIEVEEEYLIGYYSNKPKTIFERTKGNHFEFKGNDVKLQKEISKKTNANRLYMPVAAEWGYARLKPVMQWFDSLEKQYKAFYATENMISDICKDEHRKKIFIKELQKADFNIIDVYVEKKYFEKRTQDIFDRLVSVVSEAANNYLDVPEENYETRVVHRNSKGQLMNISLTNDSAGTVSIIKNVAEMMYIGKYGGLMLEDELGKEYHTLLTEYFLKMICSKEVNKEEAQLLFASHDTRILNLLDLQQIYLVDKDEDGATFVKLLDEFDIRTNNIELGYLKGRYGGIPYVKG